MAWFIISPPPPPAQVPRHGRSYWGASHELLINDFYGRLHDAEPFWISPAEAEKSLRIVKEIYRQSYPESLDAVT